MSEILARVGDDNWQDSFPVVDEGGKLRGIIPLDDLRYLATLGDGAAWTIAADLMHPPVSVVPDDDLRTATMRMLANNLREIPVVDGDGQNPRPPRRARGGQGGTSPTEPTSCRRADDYRRRADDLPPRPTATVRWRR